MVRTASPSPRSETPQRRQGEFFEAVAFAVQEKLPVVFVVEDNKYGISTPTGKFLPFHLGILDEDSYVKVDARYVDNVQKAANTAFDRARSGEGPTLIWADLDRLASHTSSDDHRVYRKLEDIEEMTHRDPIRLLAQELIKSGELNDANYEAMQKEVEKTVDDDYLRAEKKQDPRADEVMLHNFGSVRKAGGAPAAGRAEDDDGERHQPDLQEGA